MEPKLEKFSTEQAEPHFDSVRMDMEEPSVANANTDTASPHRASERMDSEEPSCAKLRMLMSPLTRFWPRHETPDPRRT